MSIEELFFLYKHVIFIAVVPATVIFLVLFLLDMLSLAHDKKKCKCKQKYKSQIFDYKK